MNSSRTGIGQPRILGLALLSLVTALVISGVLVKGCEGNAGERRDEATGQAPPPLTFNATVDPYRIVALDAPLPSGQLLPKARTCADALAWMRSKGAEPVDTARGSIQLSTTRAIQLRIRGVGIRTVKHELISPRAFASCSSTDYREQRRPLPGTRRFQEQFSVLADHSFLTPTLMLSDPGSVGELPFAAPLDNLEEITFQLRPRETFSLPFYVNAGGGASHRAGFQIELVVEVNGVRQMRILDNAGHLYWVDDADIKDPEAGYEWLEDTKVWAVNRKFDPSKLAPLPVADTRLCRAVTIAEAKRLLDSPIRAEARNENSCVWSNDLAGDLAIVTTTYPDDAAAKRQIRDRGSEFRRLGRSPVLVAGVGDEAIKVGDYFILARRGSECVEITLNLDGIGRIDPPSEGDFMAIVRAAAGRLW